MVHGVADDVQQRLEQRLDHRLVRLGLVALGQKAHGLGEAQGHLAHQPRKALENVAQRQDADGEHRALQLGHQPFELGVPILQGRSQEPGLRPALRQAGEVSDGVLGDDQLARQVHQGVDPLHVHPQRPGDWLGPATGGLRLILARGLYGLAVEQVLQGRREGLLQAGGHAHRQRLLHSDGVGRPT